MYQILANDEADDNWLLFEDDSHGVLVPRPEYRQFMCPSCHKVDERGALLAGISDKFKVPVEIDFYASSDEFFFVSKKLRDYILDSHISGLEFFLLPSTDNYYLMICNHLVKVDHEKVGFEYIDCCSQCGRYSEIIVGPLMDGLNVPEDPLTVFCAEVANENSKVSYFPIFASDTVKKIITLGKFKGIQFVEAW